ncbi:hypothetical protein Taro_011195 [Colocasia esculenta]|uniref:Uncharacterized protein n=1 Tax=Colocasia esculenta TaxID=4460 RepID=A0A843U9X1_COLES|nr:hypothetical protein [Colocasia esculenta]
MAASPELRRPSSPAEFKLVPFLGLPLAEDRGSARASPPETGEQGGGGGAGVGCRTPTSKCSKIPPITSCPPAPRKTRHVVALTTCKRRLSEVELFRVGPELMGLLFRPLDPRPAAASLPPASPATKRRRSYCQEYE